MNFQREIESLQERNALLEAKVEKMGKIILEKDERLSDLISTLNQILLQLNKPKRRIFKWLAK
jgi:hypothetical protein